MIKIYCCLWIFLISSFDIISAPTPIGRWTFDDTTNISKASIGNNLIEFGDHKVIEGPDTGDFAITTAGANYFKCFHNMKANGGGSKVNKYSIAFDFRIPSLSKWYCFFQADISNTDDGDAFVHPNGFIGISTTGYSANKIKINNWYRLVISVELGVSYKYYIDGVLFQDGGAQSIDNRFALSPDFLYFFVDNDGEANPFDIAKIEIYDKALNDQEVKDLGGFGYNIYSPKEMKMLPYLQSPTDSTIYISWMTKTPNASKVEYGLTDKLGSTAIGDNFSMDSLNIWNTVKLKGLLPETVYYYQCLSDTSKSEIFTFKTLPKVTKKTGHIRFVLISDTQDYPEEIDNVSKAIESKLKEMYGSNYNNYVNLVMHTGDISTNGKNLPDIINQYYIIHSNLSCYLPFMVSIGNHEGESENYYNLVKYDDFAGPQGEKFYSFYLGQIKFIVLNSVIQGADQVDWFKNNLIESDTNLNVKFVMTYQHYPGHSELWPDGNSSWVQDNILNELIKYPKSVLNAHGHTHGYARGATIEGNTCLIEGGGGGGGIDRWRMYPNQTNYPEIQKSFDYRHWTLIDVNLDSNSFTGKVFSLGNENLPMNNVLVDSWSYKINPSIPEKPRAINLSTQMKIPLTFKAKINNIKDSIICAEYKIFCRNGSGNKFFLLDTLICREDYFGDSGNPLFQPINLNQNIDLSELQIPEKYINTNYSYYWQIRIREQYLKWSDWSEEAEILPNLSSIDSRNDNFDMIILPNPASEYIEISLDSPSIKRGQGGVFFEIFNIFGEKTTPSNLSGLPPLLAKEGMIKIDISNLPAGIYFIKIGDRFEKFVKW